MRTRMIKQLALAIAGSGVLLSSFSFAQSIADLTKGEAAFVRQGNVSIFAQVNYQANGFDKNLFAQSNFSGIMTTGGYDPSVFTTPGAMSWGIWGYGPSVQVLPAAFNYFNTLQSWAYKDEQDMSDPASVADAAGWMQMRRSDPASNNVLLYTNQLGWSGTTEATLTNYMRQAQPDMMMFDWYIFGSGSDAVWKNGSPTGLYLPLALYRKVSLAGDDGTGMHPIPFGHWLETITAAKDTGTLGQQLGHRMSDSELRLDQFAGWVFGAKFAAAYGYDAQLDGVTNPLFFDGAGPNAKPTQEFYYEAQINKESRNIGPVLASLTSTDVRMVKGPNSNPVPGLANFDGTSDHFLKTVSATNLGTTNGGVQGDVLLGWYRPIESDLSQPVTDAQTYFMVVNGLSWDNATGSDTAQLIHLVFNFGTSGINSLERISRDTGTWEIIPLIADGGSMYHLDLTLPGGTGDLFKYNTGVPPITGVPEPTTLSVFGLGAVAALLRRKSHASAHRS